MKTIYQRETEIRQDSTIFLNTYAECGVTELFRVHKDYSLFFDVEHIQEIVDTFNINQIYVEYNDMLAVYELNVIGNAQKVDSALIVLNFMLERAKDLKLKETQLLNLTEMCDNVKTVQETEEDMEFLEERISVDIAYASIFFYNEEYEMHRIIDLSGVYRVHIRYHQKRSSLDVYVLGTRINVKKAMAELNSMLEMAKELVYEEM